MTIFNFLNLFCILYPKTKVTEGKDTVKAGFVTDYGGEQLLKGLAWGRQGFAQSVKCWVSNSVVTGRGRWGAAFQRNFTSSLFVFSCQGADHGTRERQGWLQSRGVTPSCGGNLPQSVPVRAQDLHINSTAAAVFGQSPACVCAAYAESLQVQGEVQRCRSIPVPHVQGSRSQRWLKTKDKRDQGDAPVSDRLSSVPDPSLSSSLLRAFSLCQEQTKGLCITPGLFWGLKCDFIGTQAHFGFPQRMIFSHIRIFKIDFIQLWCLHQLFSPLKQTVSWNSSGDTYWNACKLCTHICSLPAMAEASIKKAFPSLVQHLSAASKCQYYPQWEEVGGGKVGSIRELIATPNWELGTLHALCCTVRSGCTALNLQSHPLCCHDHHRRWIHVHEKVQQQIKRMFFTIY